MFASRTSRTGGRYGLLREAHRIHRAQVRVVPLHLGRGPAKHLPAARFANGLRQVALLHAEAGQEAANQPIGLVRIGQVPAGHGGLMRPCTDTPILARIGWLGQLQERQPVAGLDAERTIRGHAPAGGFTSGIGAMLGRPRRAVAMRAMDQTNPNCHGYMVSGRDCRFGGAPVGRHAEPWRRPSRSIPATHHTHPPTPPDHPASSCS